MGTNAAVRHGVEVRRRAAGLFAAGHGYEDVSKRLSVPRDTVREWQRIWKAFGSEALLSMDGKQARYTYEQKVEAARAIVDGGMSRADAMARYGIMSESPLKRWCKAYREGGEEALRPKPKGRPKGSGAAACPPTREQELERKVRRLEAEVAYLKKFQSLARGERR